MSAWPGHNNPSKQTPRHDPNGMPADEYAAQALSWLVDITFRIILPALEDLKTGQNNMTKAMDDFKVQLAAYYKKVDDWIAAATANQANSDALVAAAVAKAEADEDVDVGALAAALAAEADKVPVAPTPPAPPPDQPAV